MFSFTAAGRPWTNAHWLFQAVLFASWKAGGYAGVIALRSVVLLLTANLLLAWIWRRTGGRALETAAFALLGLSLYLPRALNARGHVFSYLFLLLLLFALDRFARGGRREIVLVPALCVLWANVHGVEYPIVLAVIAVHAFAGLAPHFGRQARDVIGDLSATRWVLLAAASAAAFVVNPFGWRIYRTALLGFDAEALEQNSEMGSLGLDAFARLLPDLELWSIVPLAWAMIAAALVLPRLVAARDWRAAGCVVLGGALALHRFRFVPEFMILAVPFVAQAVAALRDDGDGGLRGRWPRRALLFAAAYLVLAAALKVAPALGGGPAFRVIDDTLYPVGPVRLIEREGLAGHLLCRPTLSGYVTWALHPSRVRTFMDMRVPEPFWGHDVWLYKAIGDTVPLARADARFRIDLVLLERSSPLLAGLRAEAGSPFAPIWVDHSFVLFAHQRLLAGRDGLRLAAYDTLLQIESDAARPDEARAAARAEAARLADVWPGNHTAQAALLWLLAAEGRAVEAAERARALSTEHAAVAAYPLYRGRFLRASGDVEGAVEAFREALRRDPGFLTPYPELADALLAQGRASEAVWVMDTLSRHKRYRLSPAEHLRLGAARLAAGRGEGAIDAFERARWQVAADDPLAQPARLGLAAALLVAGETARALALMDEAAGAGPLPAASALDRGRALRAVGRTEEARAALARVAEDAASPPALREAARRDLAMLGGR